MDKTRIACAQSNFMKGRPAGFRPEAIVLHGGEGDANEIRARFLDGATATSSHYVVTKGGAIVQYVAEDDTAFHAGLAINPTWSLLKPNVNPNFYTIAIQLEGSAGEPFPSEQCDACAGLVAEIALRQSFPIDSDHVVLHREIRASRDCPGSTFDRGDLLQLALLTAASSGVVPASSEVEILKDANVREAPASAARIVSVLKAGVKSQTIGFTLHGETIKENSAWYQVEGGNFFWSGNSSAPSPSAPGAAEDLMANANDPDPAPPPPAAAPVAVGLNIAQIDQFLAPAPTVPVDLGTCQRDAVGIIQDLLSGHQFSKLPSILSPTYGAFGDATRSALVSFKNTCGLTPDTMLSSDTLNRLIQIPAKDPRATQAYLSLVLGIPFSGMHRILALTALMEGVGKFAALNLNTDGAGLSFGLIQWAQRPGRLTDIVSALHDADEPKFVEIFGAGDPTVADGLIAHLRKPLGGVTDAGVTTDPAFNLIAPPWTERFAEAALHPVFQQVQVRTAILAFESSLAKLRQYDTSGIVKSERAVAFMLDVANQFGDGRVQRPPAPPDKGLAGLYRRVFRPGMDETTLLQGIADATVNAMPARFQAGVRARRSLFLTTPLLAD
jgi:hypothetical protein